MRSSAARWGHPLDSPALGRDHASDTTEVSDMSSHRSAERDERLTSEAFWRWAWASIRPYLGHVLVVLGLILLVVAYFGVSRETFVARQIPYLISGGLLGLAAVTLGSRLMLIEDLRRDSGRLERLEVAIVELRAALLVQPDYPVGAHLSGNGQDAAAVTGEIGSQRGSADSVVVLSGGRTFHRSACSMVAGKTASKNVSSDRAVGEGLAACKICQPLAA